MNKKVTAEQFKKTGEEKRGCAWCKHCQPKINWWCENKEAIKQRGTSIPGIIQCPFFDFDPTKIEFED